MLDITRQLRSHAPSLRELFTLFRQMITAKLSYFHTISVKLGALTTAITAPVKVPQVIAFV